jgi:hypothetical protein
MSAGPADVLGHCIGADSGLSKPGVGLEFDRRLDQLLRDGSAASELSVELKGLGVVQTDRLAIRPDIAEAEGVPWSLQIAGYAVEGGEYREQGGVCANADQALCPPSVIV